MTDPIQTAIDELRVAFPPHPLDVKTAFDERGVTYLNVPEFEAGAHGKRWDELSPQFLEFHHDALLFLGAPVIVEVIPAYLVTALQSSHELNMLPRFLIGALTRSENTARFDAQFGRLASPQRQAIAHALTAWKGSLKDSDIRNLITEALDTFWQASRSEQ